MPMSIVFKNKIWIMGDWSKDPLKNWSDVWYTKDGKEWKKLESKVCWSDSHAESAFVFNNKIWIARGNTYPVVNDVWSLKLPENWSEDK